MLKHNIASILALAFAFTAVTYAQNCEAGYHLSQGYCCRDGTDYQTAADGKGTCCRAGSTYRHGSKGGICCGPEFPEYNEEKNVCTSTWTVTQQWWQKHIFQWFQVDGHWVQIKEGGFYIDGKFQGYTDGGVNIGGTLITITREGVMVGGHLVTLTAEGPGDSVTHTGTNEGGHGGEDPQKPMPPAPKPTGGDGGDSPCPPKPNTPPTEDKPKDTPDKPDLPKDTPGKPDPGPVDGPKIPNGPGGRDRVPPATTGNCGCNTSPPCSTDKHLGIQYGKCYSMVDTNGLPLNRETSGVYQSGGDIANLIFRICKSTTDCSADLGTPIPQHDGKFFLQDQLGWKDWQGPAWFGNSWPHFKIDRANKAVQFTGEGMCLYGHQSVCLRDGEKDRGMAAPCPLGANAAMSHIYYTKNTNSCKAYRFIETSCLSRSAEEKN